MKRTNDAGFLNYVINHPEVRPWAGTDGASWVDVGEVLSTPGNLALVNEHGGFVFVRHEPGVFEFHTQFLPSGRGRSALTAALAAERLMFEEEGADILTTYVPHDNRAALGLVRLAGFSRTHEDMDASYWALTKSDWQARQRGSGDTMTG